MILMLRVWRCFLSTSLLAQPVEFAACILEPFWLPSQPFLWHYFILFYFSSLLLVKWLTWLCLLCLIFVHFLILTCLLTFLPISLSGHLVNLLFKYLNQQFSHFAFFLEASRRYLALCYISVFSITLYKLLNQLEPLVPLGEGCHLIY